MDSHMFVNLTMNLLMHCSLPRNLPIFFSVLNVGISRIALIFFVSAFMPLSLTIYPNNFLEVTPKVHFLGFSLNLNCLILSKNLSKATK